LVNRGLHQTKKKKKTLTSSEKLNLMIMRLRLVWSTGGFVGCLLGSNEVGDGDGDGDGEVSDDGGVVGSSCLGASCSFFSSVTSDKSIYKSIQKEKDDDLHFCQDKCSGLEMFFTETEKQLRVRHFIPPTLNIRNTYK
jgi:hypothetical protein